MTDSSTPLDTATQVDLTVSAWWWVLGATGGQNTAALLIEAVLMVVIAGVLAFAADWLIALFTCWAMQQVLGVGSAQFAWLFFVVCMGIAAVLLIAAVLVPGRRTRLADLHRD